MRVLVTRPEPGASETARRLATAGHEAVILPLTGIVALRPRHWPDPTDCDAVVLSSANALRHADGMPSGLLALRCFAVGEHTAAAAREAGFSRISVAEGDASSLASLCLSELHQGSHVVYPCGRVRKPDIERTLADRGIRVSAVQTYDTVILPPDPVAETTLLAAGFPSSVLLHSVLSVQAFHELAERLDWRGEIPIVCLSGRIAGAAHVIAGAKISVAEEPKDACMIACLGGFDGDARPASP